MQLRCLQDPHIHWRHTLAELRLQKHDLTMHSLAQHTQLSDNLDILASWQYFASKVFT